jgi:hypothetical protein
VLDPDLESGPRFHNTSIHAFDFPSACLPQAGLPAEEGPRALDFHPLTLRTSLRITWFR